MLDLPVFNRLLWASSSTAVSEVSNIALFAAQDDEEANQVDRFLNG